MLISHMTNTAVSFYHSPNRLRKSSLKSTKLVFYSLEI